MSLDPRAQTLLALLEREFGARRGSAFQRQVPRHVLERALLRPAATFLARPGKQFRARLVEIAWGLCREDAPVPTELPLLVELLHAGSLVVDDIEDGSTHRRGEPALHRVVGVPLALNTGNWLYFWPFELLAGMGLPPGTEFECHRRMSHVLYCAHVGQALDLDARVHQLPQREVPAVAEAIAESKAGRLMELAAVLGALAAGAPAETIEALERFGLRLGVALQTLDDFGNLAGGRDPHKRHEDLRLGRCTHGWAWLARQLPREPFAELQDESRRVTQDGADPELLAGRMRRLLGDEPARATAAGLHRALDELRAALPPEAKLTPLRLLVEQLEASYV